MERSQHASFQPDWPPWRLPRRRRWGAERTGRYRGRVPVGPRRGAPGRSRERRGRGARGGRCARGQDVQQSRVGGRAGGSQWADRADRHPGFLAASGRRTRTADRGSGRRGRGRPEAFQPPAPDPPTRDERGLRRLGGGRRAPEPAGGPGGAGRIARRARGRTRGERGSLGARSESAPARRRHAPVPGCPCRCRGRTGASGGGSLAPGPAGGRAARPAGAAGGAVAGRGRCADPRGPGRRCRGRTG